MFPARGVMWLPEGVGGFVGEEWKAVMVRERSTPGF